MKTGPILAASIALAATVAAATPTYAGFDGGGGGGSQEGDSFENDLQRNPRLIEPGMERNRYLEYYGSRGLEARRQAWYGRQPQPSYAPNVRVRPYDRPGY